MGPWQMTEGRRRTPERTKAKKYINVLSQAGRCKHPAVSCKQDQRHGGTVLGRLGGERVSCKQDHTRPKQEVTERRYEWIRQRPQAFSWTIRLPNVETLFWHCLHVKLAWLEPLHIASCSMCASAVWKTALQCGQLLLAAAEPRQVCSCCVCLLTGIRALQEGTLPHGLQGGRVSGPLAALFAVLDQVFVRDALRKLDFTIRAYAVQLCGASADFFVQVPSFLSMVSPLTLSLRWLPRELLTTACPARYELGLPAIPLAVGLVTREGFPPKHSTTFPTMIDLQRSYGGRGGHRDKPTTRLSCLQTTGAQTCQSVGVVVTLTT